MEQRKEYNPFLGSTCSSKEKKRRKESLIEVFKTSRLGNYPNSFFGYVCVMKTLTLIIKVFLVGLSHFYGLL